MGRILGEIAEGSWMEQRSKLMDFEGIDESNLK